jgi:DNA polymerase (family 10)
MDLDDIHIQKAKEAGIRFAISSHAHTPEELDFIRYGIYQARRGWLEAGDVINTLPLKAMRALLS